MQFPQRNQRKMEIDRFQDPLRTATDVIRRSDPTCKDRNYIMNSIGIYLGNGKSHHFLCRKLILTMFANISRLRGELLAKMILLQFSCLMIGCSIMVWFRFSLPEITITNKDWARLNRTFSVNKSIHCFVRLLLFDERHCTVCYNSIRIEDTWDTSSVRDWGSPIPWHCGSMCVLCSVVSLHCEWCRLLSSQ